MMLDIKHRNEPTGTHTELPRQNVRDLQARGPNTKCRRRRRRKRRSRRRGDTFGRLILMGKKKVKYGGVEA
jgi:hypothetical protein